MTKQAVNRKISLLTINLNTEEIKYYNWSIALYSLETWTKKIGAELFGEIRNVVLEVNWEDKIIRESNQWRSPCTYRWEEDASKQYTTKKSQLGFHFLRRNCVLRDVIEGRVTEMKEVGKIIRMQLLNDLRIRMYWELKIEKAGNHSLPHEYKT